MTTVTETRWTARRRRVFESVFQTQITQPTPYSTPSLRFPDSGQPFGGRSPAAGAHHPAFQTPRTPESKQQPPYQTHHESPNYGLGIFPQSSLLTSPGGGGVIASNPHATDQIRFDRSWHTVTSRIALPTSVTIQDSFGAPPTSSQDVDDDGTFDSALADVLDPASRCPHASHIEDILVWHTAQVRQHFVSYVLPLLAACDGFASPLAGGKSVGGNRKGDPNQVVLDSIRILEAAHRQYIYGLSLIMRGMDGVDKERTAMGIFRRELHAIVGNSMSPTLVESLKHVLGALMAVILDLPRTKGDARERIHNREITKEPEPDDIEAQEIQTARSELLQLAQSLNRVGLAGERFQILFAELMDLNMAAYIQVSFAGAWRTSEGKDAQGTARQGATASNTLQIRDWIENQFSRLAVEVLSMLEGVQIQFADMEKWKEIALGRLASLRINELFDIVINWPESKGGLDDLRVSVTTPQRRLQLTDAFSAALQKRLLHPGRSTLDILRTYIAMIRTFHALDHSKVLLDRVALSLQLYLGTRDDSVRIIVTGLLASPKDFSSSDARKVKLVELAEILNDPSQNRRQRVDDDDLDWNDMDWIPDPVDAGSNYKRPKSEDVIGTLISALGSAEVFIKEFQAIIGERLLSDQPDFEQEIKVLNLLKKRFGDSSLQACDVMIKDIQDSKRLDGVIQRGAKTWQERVVRDWSINTRILSRLFWPDMGDDPFVVPPTIGEMQGMYQDIFEHLKPSRKLKWLDHLGQAIVELQLQDRTIHEEVHTYEATVIYAFGEESMHAEGGWLLEELWVKLRMDEDLLQAALDFWVKKRVIRKRSEDERYVVIERLDDEPSADDHQAGVAAESSTAAAARSTEEATSSKKKGMSEKEKEQRQVYWQFIVGMLTNSSSTMPLAQIAMMMKMLIAGGFPWSTEELQEFLAEKVADDELEVVGGKYRLVKK